MTSTAASTPKSPKPKVVLVSRCAWTLYNFRRGLIARLISLGWDVIACGAGGDGYEVRVRGLGCKFVPLNLDKGGMNPIADLRTLVQLLRLFRRERPLVVHCFTIKPVIYGSIAARLARVPRRIATITGLGYVFSVPAGTVRLVAVWLYRLAMHGVHYVFFQNPSDRDTFVREVLPRGLAHELVPGSGVDLRHFQVQRELEPGARTEVLMYGRMLWDKGVGDYIDAARDVRKRRNTVHFTLMGDPDPANPEAVPLADLERWHAEHVITYLPAVADVREVLAKADIVVLPSRHEGLPRVLLEAAAMGKVLIASDIPGCRQIVDSGVNGYLVKPGDAKELAETILRVLDNPAWLAEAGGASRRKVEAGFSEDVVIDRALVSYAVADRSTSQRA